MCSLGCRALEQARGLDHVRLAGIRFINACALTSLKRPELKLQSCGMVLLRMRQSKVRSSLLASFTTKQTNDQGTKMKPIKIQITPEMREFNDAVELADALTDGVFDHQPASVLLDFYGFHFSALIVCLLGCKARQQG